MRAKTPEKRTILPRYSLPWRQLGVAVAISLIAHLVILARAIEPFSLNFHGAASFGGLRTRTIEAPAAPQVQPQPVPLAKPDTSAVAPLASPAEAPPTVSPAALEPMKTQAEPLPEAVAPAAASVQNPSQNEPLITASVVQRATKTVVIALSSESEAGTATSVASADAPPPLELQLPSSVRLQFVATTGQRGLAREGRGQLIWQSDGKDYSLKIEASLFLITLFEWSSMGKISEVGLAPERFSERRGLRSEQAAHFRTELVKIQFSNNKPEAVLETGAQDRLSVMLLLSSLFAGNPGRIDVGSIIRVNVANVDLSETWEIRYDGQEEIQLPTGPMLTYKLTRNPRREFDRRLELWLAPSLGFMPVRILQTANNAPSEDFFDLKLSALP